MSMSVSTLVWQRSQLSGTDLLGLLAIADQANDEGYAWPARATLQEKCRLGTLDGLKALIRRLKASGELLVIERRVGDRASETNMYRVNLELLHSTEVRYFYSNAERKAAKAKKMAGGVTPVTPPHLEGCLQLPRGGNASYPGGVSPVTPNLLPEPSIKTLNIKDMSAIADDALSHLDRQLLEREEKTPDAPSEKTEDDGKAGRLVNDKGSKKVAPGPAADDDAKSALGQQLAATYNELRGPLPSVRLPVSEARCKALYKWARSVGLDQAAEIWADAVREVAKSAHWDKERLGLENLLRYAEQKADTYRDRRTKPDAGPKPGPNSTKFQGAYR